MNAKSMVRNADLWRRLDELLQVHRVTARWVRGHNGHAENEWCDQLATAAAARVAATPAPPPQAPSPADAGLFGGAATGEDDGEESQG